MRVMRFSSQEYQGEYRIEGSAGRLHEDPTDDLGDVISKTMSLGSFQDGSSQIFDGTVSCAVKTIITDERPSYPKDREKVKYQRRVIIKLSPDAGNLPAELQAALDVRNYRPL